MFGVLASVLFLASVTAIWIFIGYQATTTANVIGKTSEPMLIIEPLLDFGLIDYGIFNSQLNHSINFSVEPPIDLVETKYYFNYNISKTELNPTECNYTEDEVKISIWWISGDGFKGTEPLTDGQLLTMVKNGEGNIFEVRLDAITRTVCPVDYEVEVLFTPYL